MSGELAVDLVTDRLKIMIAAGHLVEYHVGSAFWPGAGGASRRSSGEIEIYGAREVAVSLPDTEGAVTIQTVKRWSESAEAYQDVVSYKLRPQSRIRLDDAGTYQIVCTLLPSHPAPSEVVEAMTRVYAYQTQHRPSGRSLAYGRIEGRCGRGGHSGNSRGLDYPKELLRINP